MEGFRSQWPQAIHTYIQDILFGLFFIKDSEEREGSMMELRETITAVIVFESPSNRVRDISIILMKSKSQWINSMTVKKCVIKGGFITM